MLPAVLLALSRQPQPDQAFARFDQFLGQLPAGVQLLSLFHRNPALADRLAAVLGAAPSLADHLERTPSALEGLLAPELEPDIRRLLRTRLADARGLEDAIGIIRATVREEDFSITVATMEGRMDADAAGLRRSALADAALAALLPRVFTDFAERFGRVRGGGMAVVLLGKGGGRDMMAGSDLDLMFVYDHPARVAESTGPRRLAASQWFIRAVHAFVAAVTAPDAEGPMFAVDMRLRPSGNKGPVAVSLAAFENYHATDAWTWERMALTRARVIAGPPKLRAAVEAAIRGGTGGMPARRRGCGRMPPPCGRGCCANCRRPPWDVKLRVGGQDRGWSSSPRRCNSLRAGAHPGVAMHDDPGGALKRLAGDRRPAPFRGRALLIRADRIWRTVQGMLRITYGHAPVERLSEAPLAALIRAVGEADTVDLAGLQGFLKEVAAEVRGLFIRHLGEMRP